MSNIEEKIYANITSYTLSSGLAQCETDAHIRLKCAVNPTLVSPEDLQSIASSDQVAFDHARTLCQANTLFCRQLGPMKFLSLMLDALIAEVQSPVPFKKDESVLEVLAITVKLAHFNKHASAAVNVENSHQGVFSSTPLMKLYEEILTLACAFNKKSTCVQIQIQALIFPLEGIHLATIRMIHTTSRSLLDVEEKAMFRSLQYVISKRSNPSPSSTRGASRGSRGSRGAKRNRPIY